MGAAIIAIAVENGLATLEVAGFDGSHCGLPLGTDELYVVQVGVSHC